MGGLTREFLSHGRKGLFMKIVPTPSSSEIIIRDLIASHK
jgi:hypothetical protein